MKKTCTKGLLFAALMMVIGFNSVAQSPASSKQPTYKDFISENPDADADIKLVSDYVNTIVNGDVDKATAMLSPGFKGYGPGAGDSSTAQEINKRWKESNAMQTDRKTNFLAETFNVKSGDLEGHWVATWGDYTFTQNGKVVKFPFQYTARVKDGKINRDIIYYDQLPILTALGYTITPPSK